MKPNALHLAVSQRGRNIYVSNRNKFHEQVGLVKSCISTLYVVESGIFLIANQALDFCPALLVVSECSRSRGVLSHWIQMHRFPRLTKYAPLLVTLQFWYSMEFWQWCGCSFMYQTGLALKGQLLFAPLFLYHLPQLHGEYFKQKKPCHSLRAVLFWLAPCIIPKLAVSTEWLSKTHPAL